MDTTDRYLRKRLKNWADIQQPPSGGRDRLLQNASEANIQGKNRLPDRKRQYLEDFQLRERSIRFSASALLQPFILGVVNVRPLM